MSFIFFKSDKYLSQDHLFGRTLNRLQKLCSYECISFKEAECIFMNISFFQDGILLSCLYFLYWNTIGRLTVLSVCVSPSVSWKFLNALANVNQMQNCRWNLRYNYLLPVSSVTISGSGKQGKRVFLKQAQPCSEQTVQAIISCCTGHPSTWCPHMGNRRHKSTANLSCWFSSLHN